MDPDAPPKPAFSPFLRRLDPTLAAEDENPVFEAFRRRRTMHGERGIAGAFSWRTLRLRGGNVAFAIWALVLVSIFVQHAFDVPNILPYAFLAWGLFAVVRAMIARGERTGGQQTVRLPARLVQVIAAPVGRGTRGEIDLWMAGASGETVAEAFYLELRENAFLGVAFVFLGGAAIASAVYWGAVREFRAGGVLLCAAAFWFAWRMCLGMFAGGAEAAWNRVAMVAAQWRRLANPPTLRRSLDELAEFLGTIASVLRHRAARTRVLRAVARLVVRLAAGVALVVAVVVAAGLLVAYAEGIGSGPLSPVFDALYAAWRALGWEPFAACALLLASLGTRRWIAAEIGKRAPRARVAALRNFERSYNLYMAAVIAADPDALAWADFALPEDRSRRLTERLRALLAEAPRA